MVNRTNKLFLYLMLAAFSQIAQNAFAQNKKSFRELEALALSNSQNFAEHIQKQIETDKRLSTVRWQYLPQFSASYRHITDDLFLTDDFLNTRSSLSLRLSQDLVKLFKIRPAAIEQAKVESEFAKTQLMLAQAYIIQEFRNAYINTLILKTEALHYKKSDDIYAKILTIKSKQYNSSETLLPQVLEVETKKLKYKSQFEYSSRQLENQKSGLAAFLNIYEDLILWDEPNMVIPKLDLTYLIKKADKSNLEILKQKYQSRAAAARANRAAYEDLKFELFAGIRYRSDDLLLNSSSPEVGAQLSFPFFYPWLKRAKKARFTAQKNSAIQASHTAASQTETKVRALYDEFMFLKSQQKVAGKQVELRKENLRIETSHDQNRKDDENILRLKAALAEAHFESKIAKYEYLQAYYKLLYISGMSSTQKILNDKKHLGSNFHKALWVWQAEEIITTKNTMADFINFCAKNHITQIYLSLNNKVISREKFEYWLGLFISQLHEQNIKVSALTGDPNWVFPKKQKNMQAIIKTVAEYNQQATRNKKIDAIHFDIEPQALKSWASDNKSALMNALSASLITARSIMDEYQLNMPMECDIPYFFYKTDARALEEIIQIADETVIMAYQTTNAEKLTKSVLPILELCKKFGKKMTVGIDPGDFSDKKEIQLFSQYLNKTLERITNFKGLAFHDYKNYKRLLHN